MILASHGIIASQILSTDPDWLAYYNRVIAAGGSLSTTEQDATKTLVADLKAYGIWSAMKAIYPMVGASAAACAQNLKSSSFTGTFSSGWTFASTGVTGNGTSAYIDTNFNPNTNLGLNSTAFSYYISQTEGKIPFLLSNSGAFLGSWIVNINLNYEIAVNDGFQSGISRAATAGFFQMSRTASNNVFFRHNTTLYTKSGVSVAVPNINAEIGCWNSNGSRSLFFGKEFRYFDFSDGLSSTELLNKYNAVQAFQTTLGRQV
jgi:hypothetical protein